MPTENNPWKNGKSSTRKNQTGQKNVAQNQFSSIQSKNIEVAKRITENYESSSDEEELDGETILKKLYKNYSSGDNHLLSKTASFLQNLLQSGSAICLICIGTVKRPDAIWSCKHCFCFFHLVCIKRWANDSIALLKDQTNQDQQGYYNHLGEYIPRKIKPIKWCCPQCRQDYASADKPKLYECFCGKEIDPPNQPWFVPHSCGETCEKKLKPECGHKCLLLCHPGPCPPCPQSINISCKCGKSQPKSLRCFQKFWTCEKMCLKTLPCQKHICEKICHEPGKCPPCSKTSIQKCNCKNEETLRSCSQLAWQCKKSCNAKYPCGLHNCKKICHLGPCGECPLTLPRACPCGKTKKTLPCHEAIDTCGDTCQKILSCGLHYCSQRCHKGDCSLCQIITKKKCRCGLHEKDIPCWKSFTCETKCKQTRDCGKHLCNKKCCDGQCSPCDKVCGKSLSCKKHKCKSICHDGPCYPCNLSSQVYCRCGSTSVSVPCGRERKARPICKQLCRVPSKCHHENKHRCHKGECPPCIQKCGLPNDTSGCLHICESRCHAAVKVAIRNQSTTNVWDYNVEKSEIKSLPHPKCEMKVTVNCIGGHETAEWPCWNSKPTSCQRPCGRQLNCGNHKCSLICHSIPDIDDFKEQQGCSPCLEGCAIAKPPGCTHPCQRPCHPPPCHPCSANIKSKCHCGLSQVYYKCAEYNCINGNLNEKSKQLEKLLSCGNRCVKTYSCGHRCTSTCHSGPCPNPENCRKKVRVFCACKLLKAEITCEKYRSGLTLLPCDNNCTRTKEINEKQRQSQEEKEKLLEDARNRAELEQFEKKFAKKKHKERRVTTENIKKTKNWKLILTLMTAGLAVIAAIIVAIYE